MKKIRITYWILTGLFAFVMLGSAIPDILVSPMAVEGFREMGLNPALVPFVGIAKALGVVAILTPGFPRLKEWAYAGLIFDLIGATYILIAIGKPIGLYAPMFIFIALGFGSYFFYHKKKKLPNASRETVATKGFATA
jgi:hypothetical protein